jgi:hypothetical protein
MNDELGISRKWSWLISVTVSSNARKEILKISG